MTRNTHDTPDGSGIPFYRNITDRKKHRSGPRQPEKPRRTQPENTRSGHHTGTGHAPRPADAAQKRNKSPYAPAPVVSRLFASVPEDASQLIGRFDEIVQDVLPLNPRRMQELPVHIHRLSQLLTGERSQRRVGYMNETPALSAYIRYFMWWNLVRLTPLFASLPMPVNGGHFTDGDVFLDIGSGPLTVPVALWLARPDLREKRLTWYCIDHSHTALSAGENIFLAVAARTGGVPWNIIRIKGASGTPVRKKARFVSCANMFNEMYWGSKRPAEDLARTYAEDIMSYAGTDASLLVVEPGVPRAGQFISSLRTAFAQRGFSPVSPCLHSGLCPMPGRKGGKWCHFSMTTENAPQKLHRLSREAGLPKDRAALSFIYADSAYTAPSAAPDDEKLPVRIVSDIIRLGANGTGRYGCSLLGLTLAVSRHGDAAAALRPGEAILTSAVKTSGGAYVSDAKTGAVIVRA